jgi:hypothetical protein
MPLKRDSNKVHGFLKNNRLFSTVPPAFLLTLSKSIHNDRILYQITGYYTSFCYAALYKRLNFVISAMKQIQG